VQDALARAEDQERQARLEAERQAKHRQMLARLAEIRSQIAIEELAAGGGSDGRAARAYEKTFAGWGLDIDCLAPEEAAARLRVYPPEVVRGLAGGLDQWVQCGVVAYRGQLARNAAAAGGLSLISLLGAKGQPGLADELPRWRHRLTVARQVDPDALRNRLRDALLRYDMSQFKRVAQEADAATLPTDTIQNMTPILWVIGENDMTLNLLRKAAAARPDDFWIHFYLGYYATQARHRDEALVHATAAAAIQPRNVLALQNLGMCLEMNKKDAQGLDVFRQALRLDPGAAGVHFGIGLLLSKKGDRKGAIPHLREAVRLEPGGRLVHHQLLAETLRADKDLAGALAAYQGAVRVAPRDAESHRGIGLVLQEQGKTALALTAFQEAMRLVPTPDTSLLIARALVARGSVEEAVAYVTSPAAPRADLTAQAYTACLVLQDKTGEYRACCAALLKRYGRARDAGEAYSIARCLTLAPDAGTEPAEAVRLADRAVKAQPTSAWYVHALALAHVRAGQPDKAITLATGNLRKAPVWQPSLQWLVLVLAYQRLGKADQAQIWLNQARRVPIAPVGHYVQDGVLYQCLLREAEAAQKKPAGAR
jgi:tetratricopeptide (TPR) repeat protein